MNEITLKIGLWYDANKRDLPWRHTRDAYKVWVSEIILQQTRVVQGIDYYRRFIEAFPTVRQLAEAPQEQVLKLWQGLGYYSRARNMHAAARQVMERTDQCFPTSYAELRQLKGIGPYTAAAIASLAGDEEVAVVDGNVYRVLSRLFDLSSPIDSTQGQHQFQQLADALLSDEVKLNHGKPSHHNQAMMEFGALYCTPTSPQCCDCPVSGHCLAFANGAVADRPVKQGKIHVRERYLKYIIYIYKETLWVHQRKAGDIWQGLWEFVLHESETPFSEDNQPGILLLTKRHQLTHQTLHTQFRIVALPDDIAPDEVANLLSLPEDFRQVTWDEWQQLAVPRLIDEANKRLSAWFGNDRPDAGR